MRVGVNDSRDLVSELLGYLRDGEPLLSDEK
jgi:hypothetical protein